MCTCASWNVKLYIFIHKFVHPRCIWINVSICLCIKVPLHFSFAFPDWFRFFLSLRQVHKMYLKNFCRSRVGVGLIFNGFSLLGGEICLLFPWVMDFFSGASGAGSADWARTSPAVPRPEQGQPSPGIVNSLCAFLDHNVFKVFRKSPPHRPPRTIKIGKQDGDPLWFPGFFLGQCKKLQAFGSKGCKIRE